MFHYWFWWQYQAALLRAHQINSDTRWAANHQWPEKLNGSP